MPSTKPPSLFIPKTEVWSVHFYITDGVCTMHNAIFDILFSRKEMKTPIINFLFLFLLCIQVLLTDSLNNISV